MANLSRSSFVTAAVVLLACGRREPEHPDAVNVLLDCKELNSSGQEFAFQPTEVKPIEGPLLLQGEWRGGPAESYSDCPRQEARIVRPPAGGREVPFTGAGGISDPLVIPAGMTLRLGGDETGSAPWSSTGLQLVEVFDEAGKRVSAFYLGDAGDSPLTLGGVPIPRLGPAATRHSPLTLPEGLIPAGRPVRLRVSGLIHASAAGSDPFFAIPVTATETSDQAVLVECTPEDRCGTLVAQSSGTPPASAAPLAIADKSTPAPGAVAVAPAAPPPTAPTTPNVVADSCIKKIDWKNHAYGVSSLSPKPFQLVNGEHRLTVRKVKPDPLMTLGMSEQGIALYFSQAIEADLDGEGPREAVIRLFKRDFGVYHGNSPGEDPQQVAYVFRVSEACEATPLGFVEMKPQDFLRFESGALLQLRAESSGGVRKEWRLQGDKLHLVATSKVSEEELYGPPKTCDEQKYLAALPKQHGKRPWDFSDPCLEHRLKVRLGKKLEQFHEHSGGPAPTMQIVDGYLIATFCKARVCGGYHAAYAVDVKTGEVSAAIEALGKVQWFASGEPPAPLKAVVAELQAQSRAPQ